MIRTLGHTDAKTIKAAPEALHELRGFMLAHEHDQKDWDTSWFQMVRSSVDYAINLAEEAREHFLGRDKKTDAA